ncbi:uncharacterized protein LOC130783352 [Actinidia eriantha]|uniref:uncharacterized protein LOC130783352 n=1 Tax=Actinidia eriantha TaxID=165200 RepID=UPI0025889BCE|nr:uncharacterized protein LOC130783352 [Actinidia eriantha]
MGVRFKRVAEAFDEAARARRLCQSSGSEHSPEAASSVDLSDLVKSFVEREGGGGGDGEEDGEEREGKGSDWELEEELRGLLGCEDDEIKLNIRGEAEEAYRAMGNGSSLGLNRGLMTRLRERGFDAGLCKSKWDRIGRLPSGSHEYIEVNTAGTRYIIEVNLASEFEIARPTETYTSLLQLFPQIFVGKVEELKQVVRLMCNATKYSMERVGLHVPPWRRFGYVQAKWFGSYKRTINEVSVKNGSDSVAKKRSIGFVRLPEISNHCREDFHFASKVGLKVGQLTIAFNGHPHAS